MFISEYCKSSPRTEAHVKGKMSENNHADVTDKSPVE
jgi:hypothetical protein